MKYDIFVSYRRTSFESANLIAEKLRSMGYSVFFDVETLRSGKFNEQLFDVIDNCKDFVLVLPPDALDRCKDENDWVRKEVMHAMAKCKNIIPVMLSGFEWPSPMPQGMEDLANYQAITAGEREYFDMSMQRLAGYLKSKPHKSTRQFFKKAAAVLAIILILVGIGMFAIHQTMMPLHKNVASNVTVGMGILDVLNGKPETVMKVWKNFVKDFQMCKTDDQREQICTQFDKTLDNYSQEAKFLHQQFSRLPAFSSKDVRLLGYYGVTTQEIEGFYGLFDAMFNEFLGQLEAIRNIQEKKYYLDKEIISYELQAKNLGFEMFSNMLENIYYSYMELMSKFPSSAQELHNTLSPEWKTFPNNLGLDKSIEEYRQYQDAAYNKAEKAMIELEKLTAEYRGRIDVQKEIATK